jgi:transposase
MFEVSSMSGSKNGARPARRRFTHEYKLRVLQQYEALADLHERGALLRREGLYTSHIALWRQLRDAGSGTPHKRGRKPKSQDAREVERLQREIVKLKRDLARAEMIIEAQGKVSALLHQLADKSQAEESER